MNDNSFKFYGYKIVGHGEKDSGSSAYKHYTEPLNELVEANVIRLYGQSMVEYILVFMSDKKDSINRKYLVNKDVYASAVNYLNNIVTA